ncbi:REP-associated tyrosine transposase [Pontibacter harenae]|uniref:REP-associated tyrosine transposase n=1 Tax=Pontibacter harenae TaxID=2894083 RepID=UPI001E46CB1F|nr:transposase [Pontibacter harenae]MCC9168104.1 transposase [Pontibacter harenae]
MSEKYKIYQDGLFFVTLTVVGWIDVFTRREYAEEVTNNLNYCSEKKGLRIYSFCLMPSHLHMIYSTDGNLSDILRDFKSYTGKRVIKLIENNPQESRKEWLLHLFKYFGRRNSHNSNFQFWQQHNHPLDLTNTDMLRQKQEYIHMNPVNAGIVTEPQYYTLSSAN